MVVKYMNFHTQAIFVTSYATVQQQFRILVAKKNLQLQLSRVCNQIPKLLQNGCIYCYKKVFVVPNSHV